VPRGLLEGTKVVDFSWVYTGPLTTKTLADCGATVIRVESRNRLDVERTMPPYKDDIPGLNRTASFNTINTSKLSITLNLAYPKGVEVAKRLVAWADVVTENYSGGTMRRMGLGYDELKKVNPEIIMLSTSIMGQTGPHAESRNDGNRLTGLAGYNHITGWPDQEPATIGPFTDFVAPLYNLVGILAALDYRRRAGKGQYLDMSQYENGVSFLAPLILDHAVNQRVADRTGNSLAHAAPHGVYRCLCEARWCAVAVFTDEEWESFVEVIGHPTWTEEPRFRTLLARKANEEELDSLVQEWTLRHSAEDVMSIMQAAGVAAGVVEDAEDRLEHDPQFKHRHYFLELEHPEIGRYVSFGAPFVLSKVPYQPRSAPLIGEHNGFVLKDVLGMSDAEIADLVVEGVIE